MCLIGCSFSEEEWGSDVVSMAFEALFHHYCYLENPDDLEEGIECIEAENSLVFRRVDSADRPGPMPKPE